jgi:preprotein translocase subunit YajC
MKLLALVLIPLLFVALWAIVQSRREQKRLREEIERKAKVIDLLDYLGRRR